jgi:PAS domain S-box-containing protein
VDRHPAVNAAGRVYTIATPERENGPAMQGEGKFMTKKETPSNPAADLRRRAEAKARADETKAGDTLSPEAAGLRVHELRVYQIELEMQNEELRRAQEELEASRERYFDLYDMAPVGYFTLSETGLILEANLTAAALLGVTRDAQVKQPLTRFILCEDQDIFYQHRRQLFETGLPQACELRILCADTDPVWVRIEATVARDIDGAVQERAVMSDITERKRAEETLRESIQRYELVLEGSAGGVWDWDILNKRAHLSSGWKMMRGYADAEIGDSETEWSSRIHPDDMGRVMAAVEAHFAGKTAVFEEEYRVRCKHGSWIWVLDRGKAVRDPTGRVIRMAGSEIDITERKRAEDVRNFLAQTSSAPPSKGFFQLLAQYLAESLGMDFVCIDRLEGDGLTARTVAVWNDGKFEDNVSYALKDTPCGDVVGKTVCCFPASVCQFFPKDDVLRDLRAESYIGVTLWSHTGQPIGLIAVIGRRPLANRALAESVLKLVSERAAGELERQDAEQALLASEERHRTILHTALDGFMVTDMRGRLLEVNEAYCRMSGYSREELLDKRISDLEAVETGNDIPAHIQKIMAKGEDRFESRHSRKDGSIFDVEVSVQYRALEGGQFVAFLHDITERKRVEEDLTDLRNRLAADLSAMLRLHEINSRSMRGDEIQSLLEMAVSAAIDITEADLGNLQLVDDDSGRLVAKAQRGFQQPFLNFFAQVQEGVGSCGTAMRQKRRVVVEDITQSPIFAGTPLLEVMLGAGIRAVQSTPLITRSGRLVGMISTHYRSPHRPEVHNLRLLDLLARTVADLVDQMQSQAALHQFREDLDRAQAVGNIGSWRLDTQRNVLTWSAENHRIFGIPEGTPMTYETFLSTIHPDDRDAVDTQWKAALRGEDYDIEHRLLVGGVIKWVREKAYLEFDAEGELAGGFGITQDITERKRMELELLQARDLLENRVQERTRDLAQTTLQLRALATELILTEERERREVASALHDSLGPLLSFSKRELGTLRKTIPAQFAETLDHIRGHISQAIEQTRSLTIDLSPPTLYTLGLGHALEELGERFAAEHNFRCVFRSDASIPSLPDDIQVLLYRSVREMFVNIVKHAQATSVQLTLSMADNHIRIAVEDDGVGMKKPAIHSADGQQNGFGLFTIRQRLEQAGGRLEIGSPNGQGTLVAVQVPLKTTKPSTRRKKR